MHKKIIFIVGPTAIGKSKIAISLAKKINAEIISCDSMQVYKGLNILSAKPAKLERKYIRHHLIDILSPQQYFNVSKFIKLSKRLIKEIHKRGKIPILVGGTGLYIDSLLNGIFKGPAENSKIRNELYRKAKVYGNSYLYQRLKKVDSKAAEKIHPNDLRKIIRSLEVYQITKTPISELQKQRSGILQDKQYDIAIFGINMPREKLYENINKRVERMFKQGAVKELSRILKNRTSKTFKQALGIKEIGAYLRKEADLKSVKELLKQNTRRFAKRQLTWFRKNNRIQWLDASNCNDIIKKMKVYIHSL